MPLRAQTVSTLRDLECSSCGERHDPRQLQGVCRSCGRALLARYDLEAAAPAFGSGTYREGPASMWRYAAVLPFTDPAHIVTLGEGMTPLERIPRLGRELGLERLYVKDEGQNPTGSFKARGLSAAVTMARGLGVTDIALPTAGNAGGAAAAYAARAGLTAHVAMPVDAPPVMIDEVRAYGAGLELVDGLISDAGKLIARGAREHGWFDVATMKEPYRLEGKKTLGYELWEQLGGELPDAILYPTGGGTGLIGMWKAFSELECMGLVGPQRPRMISVQAAGCAPVVEAFRAGKPRAEPWQDAATVAAGLRVPMPFADDLILQAVADSGGEAVAVSEEEILAMVREAAHSEGLDLCPEAAAAVAAARNLAAASRLGRDERVVIFVTSTGLKHPEVRDILLGRR